MAITLVGTSSGDQGLFNRLGKLLKLMEALDTLRLTTLPDSIEAAIELFDGCDPEVREAADGLLPTLADLRAANNPTTLAAIAEAIVIQMVNEDSPRPDDSLEEALAQLIKQIVAAGDYVDATTVSVTITQTSLDGDGVVLGTVIDGLARTMQNLIAETLEIRGDDNNGLNVLGPQAVDRFDYRWPAGSGSNAVLPLIQADGEGNLLTNGSLDSWTGVLTLPDDWDAITGGATINEESSVVYKAGGKALKITSDGATLTGVKQLVDGLDGRTVYAVNLWAKMNTAPAAGVLTVDLYDGTSVLQDEAGNNCSFTIDLTTLGTTYVPKNAFFRMADPVPETVYLRLHLTTALTNTRILYIDHVALGAAERPSGDARTPYLIAFEGATAFSQDDGAPDGPTTFTAVTANNYAGEWQQGLDRLFDMASRELQLPTSGGGSEIAESLMT